MSVSTQAHQVLQAARRGVPRPTALRDARERLIRGLLLLAAAFSVLTTATIVGTLAWETFHFIRLPEVTLSDFLLGTTWSPLLGAEKHFGIWPLVCGTLLVSAVGAAFALPVGLVTAVYLSEYAPPRVRATLKPVLEVLAGVPTVVYGFFALMVITPALQAVCTWAFGRPVFPGYNATGAPGWEWFELKESAGTPVIVWRGEEPPSGEGYVILGSEDTAVDGDCNSCHQAAYDNDYVHEVPL